MKQKHLSIVTINYKEKEKEEEEDKIASLTNLTNRMCTKYKTSCKS